jgi:hypothetical protein
MWNSAAVVQAGLCCLWVVWVVWVLVKAAVLPKVCHASDAFFFFAATPNYKP